MFTKYAGCQQQSGLRPNNWPFKPSDQRFVANVAFPQRPPEYARQRQFTILNRSPE
jgi:hypothetical protein